MIDFERRPDSYRSARADGWLPTAADQAYVASLMRSVTDVRL